MARRSKALDSLIGLVFVVGLVAVGIVKFFEQVGFLIPGIVVVGAAAVYAWIRYDSAKQRGRTERARHEAQLRGVEDRRATLLAKYGDHELVERMLASQVWIGQSRDQLVDSIGSPHDVDQKVLKTKKKEVWKYGHKGAGRYSYRVTLDNDLVVGWDEKA